MENPIMFNKRFVNLKEVKSLLKQKEEIEKQLSQVPVIHCRRCGDTKPVHLFEPIWGMAVGEGIYETSGNMCNRCSLNDKQYEERFGVPKEVVPDFINEGADTKLCTYYDEAQGRHFCYNKKVDSVTCQGICKYYREN